MRPGLGHCGRVGSRNALRVAIMCHTHVSHTAVKKNAQSLGVMFNVISKQLRDRCKTCSGFVKGLHGQS